MSNKQLISLNTLCIPYYQQRVSKNAIPMQIVPSTDKIYQEDFPKLVALKRSTKGPVSSFFSRVA